MEDHGFLIFKTGSTAVAQCGNHGYLPKDFPVAEQMGMILKFLQTNHCHQLAFDLDGLHWLPSSFLGMINVIYHRGIHVYIINACKEVREIIEIAHLDNLIV